MSDPRLLFKQYKFCEKQKELTDEFKAKVLLHSLYKMFSKSPKYFNENVQFPHDVSQRNVTAANTRTPKTYN